MGDLNERQKLFCKEYLVDRNGSRAAKAVGYKPSAARAQASWLLTNPDIRAEVDRLTALRAKKTQTDSEFVISSLKKLATANVTEVAGWKGEGSSVIFVKSMEEVPDDIKYAISEISDTKHGIKIKFHSKEKALELLGKHNSLFVDKQEITHRFTYEDMVMGSMKEDDSSTKKD